MPVISGSGSSVVTPLSLMAAVEHRLGEVRARIAAASSGRDVRIVAVTKGFGIDVVEAAVGAGLADLGENYAQELQAKANDAPPGVRWHFLGVLQTNKAARLAPLVSEWEAVDRPVAGDAIARHRQGAVVFVEVNVTGDPARHGCRPSGAAPLVDHLRSRGLDVRGLMAVGPAGDHDASRDAFRRLAQLGRQLGLGELSMGMSDDYEVAIEEGATTVRLGRALFGPRPGAGPARRY